MSTEFSTAKNKHTAGVFVMPVFLDAGSQAIDWLEQAVDSVRAQTDPDWQLVMINDQSPNPDTAKVLKRLQARDSRIHVITNKVNRGPGAARNSGIQWAHKNGHPLILYLDADDISHPRRLETVRRITTTDRSVGVVYSTFMVVDENDCEVAWDRLAGSIQEILESHRDNPPQGTSAWIEIGTVTGYTNLTSSTAVITELATKQPFPEAYAAEDTHTWFRYAAEGMRFVYEPSIPSKYRIPQATNADSAMRDRVGGVDAFYATQCNVVRDSFAQAIDIAIANGNITADQRERLMTGYHVRMGESMRRFGLDTLAEQEVERANEISPQLTKEWIRHHGYDWAKSLVRDAGFMRGYQQALEE